MVAAIVSCKSKSGPSGLRTRLRNRFREMLIAACNISRLGKASFLRSRLIQKPLNYRFRPRFQLLEERRLLAGTISGRIWFDADYDGIQDGSETQNFANVDVKLHRSGEADRTSTTNANGLYSFDVPANGGYHMSFTFPAGYTLTRAIDDTHLFLATDTEWFKGLLMASEQEPAILEEKNRVEKLGMLEVAVPLNPLTTLDFPSEDSKYHNYDELVAALHDAATELFS